MSHYLNFFKITNLAEISMDYKLVEVDLQRIEDKAAYLKNLHRLCEKVASDTKGPMALLESEGQYQIAVPTDRTIRKTSYNLVGGFVGKIMDTNQLHTLNFNNLEGQNRLIAHQLLNFEIKRQLNGSPLLWNLSSSYYFTKVPINKNEESEVDVYGGFKYKIVEYKGDWYVCLDVTYKYLGRGFLSEIINESNKEYLLEKFRYKRFLYFYGDNWYQVQLDGFGKNVKAQEFYDINRQLQNVYDYTMANAQSKKFDLNKRLKERDISILYKYPNRSMEARHGSSSLAKLIYSTDHPDVQSLHNYSIKDPVDRFREITKNIKYNFQNLHINGTSLRVTDRPLEEKLGTFDIPTLKFNNDETFGIEDLRKIDDFNIRSYGKERKKKLLKNGIINKRRFGNQYLIVPDTLELGLIRALSKSVTERLKSLAENFTEFKIVVYKSTQSSSAYKQVNQIKAALSASNATQGCALLILPDLDINNKRTIRSIHDFLYKDKYPNLKFQCATQSNIVSFFRSYPDEEEIIQYRVPDHLKQRYSSYLLYLSLAVLLVNRRWLYALEKPLNYDVYIGMDVHERFVGFCYFYRNGENIIFSAYQTVKRVGSFRNEKISKELIVKKVTEQLKKDIPNYAPNPNGIVILRDGRSFGEEEEALTTMIEQLDRAKLIDKDMIKWGVVDLHKKSTTPIRIVSKLHGNKISNPKVGTYVPELSENSGAICNTGFPFKLRGTSGPMIVEMAAGNLDKKLVLQDVFGQSLLAFSAPDKCNALPITIKLIDVLIQPLTFDVSEELLESEDLVTVDY